MIVIFAHDEHAPKHDTWMPNDLDLRVFNIDPDPLAVRRMTQGIPSEAKVEVKIRSALDWFASTYQAVKAARPSWTSTVKIKA